MEGIQETETKPLSYYLEEARMSELVAAVKQGTLGSLLWKNYAVYEAKKLNDMIASNPIDDRDVLLELTNLFPALARRMTAEEKYALKEWLAKRRTIDSESGQENVQIPLVATQEEFVQALKRGAKEIYLDEGEFDLPLLTDIEPVKLHGIHNPVVNIRSDGVVNLAAYPYTMTGLTLFLQRPELLQEPLPAYASELVILADEFYSTRGREGYWNFLKLAEGCRPYASFVSFAEHVEELPALAIGTATLNTKDYDVGRQAFRVHPVCLGRFFDVWEKGPAQMAWYLSAAPEEAETLLCEQRKLRLFAWFRCGTDGKLFIASLFLRTTGHAPLELTSAPLPIAEEMPLTSGFGGYGLHLIDLLEEEQDA